MRGKAYNRGGGFNVGLWAVFGVCTISVGPLQLAGGHMVQNPKYLRAKECDKIPLGNVNKEKSHFSSFKIVFCFGVWHILLLSNILDFVPCDLQLQRACCMHYLFGHTCSHNRQHRYSCGSLDCSQWPGHIWVHTSTACGTTAYSWIHLLDKGKPYALMLICLIRHYCRVNMFYSSSLQR